MVYIVCNRNQYWVLSSRSAKSWNNIKILMLFHDCHVRPWFVKVHYFQVDYCIKTSKEKCVFMLQKCIFHRYSIAPLEIFCQNAH
jgi:hypothetical protein